MADLNKSQNCAGNKPPLSHERLLLLLTYDPETGLFRRNVPTGKFKAGSVSGSVSSKHGYWEVSVDGVRYYGHRLAWFYMTGSWPPITVDHENTIRSDNKWNNLRLATKAEQVMNTPLFANNTSGTKGIYWDDRAQKWCCEIKARGEKFWLGRFEDLNLAKSVVAQKRHELHGKFARSK
jgi:hypothetical protein